MMLKFEKYHGAGNDFIILDGEDLIKLGITKHEKIVKQICDRHYGIGSDGCIILKYEDNIPRMIFYNPDGSRAPMCGNGIRTFVHYLKNNKIEKENSFLVKTDVGLLRIQTIQDRKDFFVKVNMGKPVFDVKKFIKSKEDRFLREKIVIDDEEIEISYIFMGTDHAVIFVNDFNDYDINELGSKIENYVTIFPKKVNVNFVKIHNTDNIEVITWERGAGRTLACGTGITASAILARIFGYVDNVIQVKAPGGKLQILYNEEGDEAHMIGTSEKIAYGIYCVKK